jgi:hypothetical protein
MSKEEPLSKNMEWERRVGVRWRGGGAFPGTAKSLEECHWANETLNGRAAVVCML